MSLALSDVDHLLLIDDGSSDATVAVIRAWQQRHADQAVTLLELTRNFGKEAAMLAGLDYANARCAAAVLIDSDLQHPPERIPVMVQAWRDGAEVVTAVRDDRDAEGLVKVATASWFYRVFNRLVDSIQLQEGAGDFRLLSAPVVEAVTQLREATRFSKGLMPWTGYRSEEIAYSRVARVGGNTSWSSLQALALCPGRHFFLHGQASEGMGRDRCADFIPELCLCRPDRAAHSGFRCRPAGLCLNDRGCSVPWGHSVDWHRRAGRVHRSDLRRRQAATALFHQINSPLINSIAAKRLKSFKSSKNLMVKLNLGCGDKILQGYVNVDTVSSRSGRHPDFVADIRDLRKIKSSIADEILAVHVIEHFYYWEVVPLLKSWRRLLKPGGKLILECPNLLYACQVILKNPAKFSQPGPAGQMSMWPLYGDPRWRDPLMCHKWAYTPDSLMAVLHEAGLMRAQQEPAQFKLREPRDMRITAINP